MRAGTSFARSIQTGELRGYALLLLMGMSGLLLYFLVVADVTIHLSIVVFLPLATGLAGGVPAVEGRRAGWWWRARWRCWATRSR